MPRYLLAACVILASHLVSGSTAAQSTGFSMSSNPYVVSAEVPLVLRNDGAVPITLDSLAFDGDESTDGYGWSISITGWVGDEDAITDGTVCGYAPEGGRECESLSGRPIQGPYARADSLTLSFSLYCAVCRAASGPPPLRDSLQVFWGGHEDPQKVAIHSAYPPSTERPPGVLSASVGPNPTAGPLALRLVLDRDVEATVAVVDALGRVVHQTVQRFGSGRQTVPLDLHGHPPGVYILSVRAEGVDSVLTQRLTLLR